MSGKALDLSSADLSELIGQASAYLATLLDGLADAPISDRSSAASVLADPAIRQPPSEAGRPLADLLDVIDRARQPSFVDHQPRLPGLHRGERAGDQRDRGPDRERAQPVHGHGRSAPGLVAMEADLLRWLAELVGMPTGVGRRPDHRSIAGDPVGIRRRPPRPTRRTVPRRRALRHRSDPLGQRPRGSGGRAARGRDQGRADRRRAEDGRTCAPGRRSRAIEPPGAVRGAWSGALERRTPA